MGEILKLEREMQLNPYVSQVSKLSKSLHYLADAYGEIDKVDKLWTMQEIQAMGSYLEETYPNPINDKEGWFKISKNRWKEVILQVLRDVDDCGAEMSIEKRGTLEREIFYFPEVCEYIHSELSKLKHKQIIRDRIQEGKQGSMYALHAFAKAVEESAKELDKSIFEDERIQKKISNAIKRGGVRPLKVTLLMSEKGNYEVQITAKAKSDACVTTKQIAEIISRAMGREFIPEIKERFILKDQYTTLIFVERPAFYTLHGVAKIEKNQSPISGDNFLIMDMPRGKKAVVLSDGMGSGEEAFQVSKSILEMTEALLESGVSPSLSVEMVNALITCGNDSIKFGTMDMSVIDVYSGNIEIVKAGAASTFIIHQGVVNTCAPTSLPLGVLNQINMNHYQGELKDDTYLIMLTDGVTELIEDEDKGAFIQSVLNSNISKNPKDLAEAILDEVLESQDGIAIDDMLVMVMGVWSTNR